MFNFANYSYDAIISELYRGLSCGRYNGDVESFHWVADIGGTSILLDVCWYSLLHALLCS
jgi:hypothetical protein